MYFEGPVVQINLRSSYSLLCPYVTSARHFICFFLANFFAAWLLKIFKTHIWWYSVCPVKREIISCGTLQYHVIELQGDLPIPFKHTPSWNNGANGVTILRDFHHLTSWNGNHNEIPCTLQYRMVRKTRQSLPLYQSSCYGRVSAHFGVTGCTAYFVVLPSAPIPVG